MSIRVGQTVTFNETFFTATGKSIKPGTQGVARELDNVASEEFERDFMVLVEFQDGGQVWTHESRLVESRR